jgi:hypothetical protein
MKRILITATAVAALAAPAAAPARVVELGSKITRAEVSCPTSCQAVGRVTGYQERGGTVPTAEGGGTLQKPFRIPRRGKIVAFTVRLGKPTAAQRTFFEDLYPGEPAVRLSVLRPGTTRRTRNDHRLLAQSPSFRVREFFGSAPTFALDRPITVRRGNVVAITVPTWAPMLAVSLARNFSWKSSRTRRRCEVVTQRAALERLQSTEAFGCTYSTARLYYTATYIPNPRPPRN